MIAQYDYKPDDCFEYRLNLHYHVTTDNTETVLDAIDLESLVVYPLGGAYGLEVDLGQDHITHIERELTRILKDDEEALDACWADWEEECEIRRDDYFEKMVEERHDI